MSGALLEVANLVQEFTVRDRGGVKAGTVHAVSDVSFTLHTGEGSRRWPGRSSRPRRQSRGR
jgi:ABC-type antimicrobial peptide transport system ATPase subunit